MSDTPAFSIMNPITGEKLCAIYPNGDTVGLPNGVTINRIRLLVDQAYEDGFKDGQFAAAEAEDMNA